jgi:hypothetical protein
MRLEHLAVDALEHPLELDLIREPPCSVVDAGSAVRNELPDTDGWGRPVRLPKTNPYHQ